ncbi:MAG: hypothetical protein SF002_10990 [Alphaproteobacteria bacterium]|nr:hypothetical protein [Alphaproteobacteria bacterium]
MIRPLSLLSLVAVAACSSNPLSLIPPQERALLMAEQRLNGTGGEPAQRLTVADMLARARGGEAPAQAGLLHTAAVDQPSPLAPRPEIAALLQQARQQAERRAPDAVLPPTAPDQPPAREAPLREAPLREARPGLRVAAAEPRGSAVRPPLSESRALVALDLPFAETSGDLDADARRALSGLGPLLPKERTVIARLISGGEPGLARRRALAVARALPPPILRLDITASGDAGDTVRLQLEVLE